MNTTKQVAGRKAWMGLIVLVIPAMLVSMDLSVLLYALPQLSAALKPSSTQLLWIMDIYGFLLAGLLITMGMVGDRVGRKKMLLIGAVFFGAASVVAAFSNSSDTLIVARALQGIAGATLGPSTLSIIRSLFPDEKHRRAAIGIWTSAFASGIAIGPIIGGVLLEHFWWGSVFLINVPAMLLLLIAGPFFLPESKSAEKKNFDLSGALLSIAAVLTFIYGVKHAASDGLDTLSIVCIAGGLAIGIVYVVAQLRKKQPGLDLRLFKNVTVASAVGSTMIMQLSLMGITLFIVQYLQLILGMSPMTAALWGIPGVVVVIGSVTVATMLAGKVKPMLIMAFAIVLAGIGFAIMSQSGLNTLAILLVGNAMVAGGMASVSALSTDVVVASVPSSQTGAASALAETINEFGGALGFAVLGSIGMSVYRGGISAQASANIPVELIEAAKDTLGEAKEVAARLPASDGAALYHSAQQSFVHSIQTIAVICAIAMAAVAIVVAINAYRKRNKTNLTEPVAHAPVASTEPL